MATCFMDSKCAMHTWESLSDVSIISMTLIAKNS